MPYTQGLLDLRTLQRFQIDELFHLAQEKKNFFLNKKFESSPEELQPRPNFRSAALIFFEPSTRTRFSFELACQRSSVSPLIFSSLEGTSLQKGETLEDTIHNIAAMGPSLLIVRAGSEFDLSGLSQMTGIPVINAGWGKEGHPTQALLDAFCWSEFLSSRGESISGKKLLVVGDIRHSRVAASHRELAQVLDYEIAWCGPTEFLPPEDLIQERVFKKLQEGLEWCDAVMALRVQIERHQSKFSLEDYRRNFQLNFKSLSSLSGHAFIFHPGPINYGIEMDSELHGDPRYLVLQQVSHGVWLRQALIEKVLFSRETL